jgi:hypothetical protein
VSVIDLALWDLAGRLTGLPVHKLLGGARGKDKAYASSFNTLGMPDDYAAHALDCRGRGYRAYKIHPYHYWNPATREPARPDRPTSSGIGHRGSRTATTSVTPGLHAVRSRLDQTFGRRHRPQLSGRRCDVGDVDASEPTTSVASWTRSVAVMAGTASSTRVTDAIAVAVDSSLTRPPSNFVRADAIPSSPRM